MAEDFPLEHFASFGQLLRHLRKRARLTLRELSIATGYSEGHLANLERDARRPDVATVQARLLPALDVGATSAWARHLIDLATAASQPHQRHANETGSRTADPPATTLLTTKLYRPTPDPNLVHRPRLFARLDAGLGRPVTLVAAPAGAGKTTLIAAWLASLEERKGQSAPRIEASKAVAARTAITNPGAQAPGLKADAPRIAWLTLDAGDADPVSFLRYLIRAFQTLAPGAGAVTLALLDLPQVAPITTLMARLVNELAVLPEPSVLVLDDYHVIDSLPVYQALAFLVDHLPPQLHLVIGSRSDPALPLARLRARRQLVELRAADLRFTPDEAAAFLTDVMALPLTPTDIETLEARTEGWIAGLQLAALSLQDRSGEQLTSCVAAFAGSHRFVVDYLADEVLAAQPVHVQRFLLATSILDRMCGTLCDALLDAAPNGSAAGGQRPDLADGPAAAPVDSFSQVMLERLERSNLFTVPLDDQRQWYRYHHLFAQVLRQRLRSGANPETVAALHRRAASWFAGQGLVAEAVGHSLSASDWVRAAALISAHGRSEMVRGQIHTVLGWLASLPAELKAQHPTLQLLQATAGFFRNQHSLAEQHLQAAEEGLSADRSGSDTRSILGYIALLRGSLAVFRGDLAERDLLATRAMNLLPLGDSSVRAVAQTHLALACERSGEAGVAQERQLREAIAAVRVADEPGNVLYALVGLAALYQRQGRLTLAAATYAEAAATIPDPIGLEALPNGANYYFGLGALYYEWNDLARAEALLQHGRAIVRAQQTAEAAAVVRGYATLMQLHLAQGDPPSARTTLDELDEVALQHQFVRQLHAQVAALRAQLALAQHDVMAALGWLAASGLRVDDLPDYPREQEYLTMARVLLAAGQADRERDEVGELLALLDRLQRGADVAGRLDSVIQIAILQAMVYHARGRTADGLAQLERALELAGSGGYVRRFVDEGAPMAALLREARGLAPDLVSALLSAFPGQSAAAPHAGGKSAGARPFGDPLSERELEVLHLVALGYANRAIAQALTIEIGTVKRHIHSLFGKLGVHSRTAAIARARTLGLL